MSVVSSDSAETVRREEVARLNADPGSREALEAKYGEVYDTSEMQEHFEALGFMAPYVIVRRKADGQKGSLEFQHSPRFYFRFQPAT